MNFKSKRLTVVAVGLVTILPQTFASAQTANRNPGFADVPENHWAWNSISKMAQAGFIEGDQRDHFRGNDAMTRYEFAVAFSRFQPIVGPSAEQLPATLGDVNKILDRLTAIENRLSELENKVTLAPAKLESSELPALHLEVKTATDETRDLLAHSNESESNR